MEVKNYFAFTAENKPIPFCTAYLYEAGTSNLVSGLTDKNGNPIDNPFQADKDGLVQFAGPNGVYDLRFKSSLRDYRIRVSIIDTAAILNAADQVGDLLTQIDALAAAAETAKGIAESAADAAAASGEVYDSTADALSNGVYSLDSLVAGSGGTDGTYPLAFSGGGGSGAAGWFTVASGAVSAYQITARGVGYTSAPTVSFAASSGLTGASATAVISANREVGQYFYLRSVGDLFREEYVVEPGPVASATDQSLPSSAAISKKADAARVDELDVRTGRIFSNDAPGVSLALSGLSAILAGREVSSVFASGATDGDIAALFTTLGEFVVRRLITDGGILGNTYEIDADSSQYPWGIADAAGNIALALLADGDLAVSGGGRVGGGQSDWEFAVIDSNDYVGFGIKNGIVYPLSAGDESQLDKLDRRNRARSEAIANAPMRGIQYPTASYNIIMSYGQSLGEGNETWPSLSKSPQPGSMMYGDNVDNQAATIYEAMGADVLNPLVAHTAVAGANIDGAAESALVPGDGAKGEPPVVGLTNGLKWDLNQALLVEDDSRKLVALNSSQAGKTIEQLSKINNQDGIDRYGGMLDGIQQVYDLVDPSTCVVPIITWLQGEWDYSDSQGSANATYALYSAALNTLFDDAGADAVAITGQGKPPLFVTYQTGASYTRDADVNGAPGLHVGMAQLDVTLSRNDAVMAGPVYPYTDKGGHLDSNGSRWFGHQMAKVAKQVFLDRKNFEPLRPLAVEVIGRVIRIHFHVPSPPLVFGLPYVVSSAVDYAAKGFRVTDVTGVTDLGIASVDIVRDTIVELSMAADVPADALLWYASKTGTNGNGNLHDSDDTVAIDCYEYVPDRGMYASANIPALVGKPYPLHNWCVAFCIPVTYSEI
ncbi:hypothetical protein [Spongiibacter tropicus]|uniref:hypothetical protein n=1 Tax=Spongiibacter tropicus TaxID=454602 RepID=UPI0035BE9CF5